MKNNIQIAVVNIALYTSLNNFDDVIVIVHACAQIFKNYSEDLYKNYLRII